MKEMNKVRVTTTMAESEIEINKKSMLDFILNCTTILNDAEEALEPIYEKLSDKEYFEMYDIITDCITEYTDRITNKLAECKFIKLIFE